MQPVDASYMILAPISVLAGLCFLSIFLYSRKFRESPNDLVLGQIMAQTLFDAHWLTAASDEKYPDWVCQMFGAIALYSYTLAFVYTACMSLVLIKCLRSAIREQEFRRVSWLYHAFCLSVPLVYIIPLLCLEGIGQSVMKTCSLRDGCWSEVTLIIPQILISPLVVTVVGYSYWKYNQRYKQYIIRHMSAVGALSLSWLPAGILHFWNYKSIGNPNHFMKDFASITGAMSGFLTILAMLLTPQIVLRLQSKKAILVESQMFRLSTGFNLIPEQHLEWTYNIRQMDVLQVSYTVLAPISVFTSVCFLAPFAFFPRLRKPPNSLIIWQMISQTVFDLHWFSALYNHEDAKPLCQMIGTVGVYGYFLAFMYTACMSWVIIQCLRNPIREQELRETSWRHHLFCHLTSLLLICSILAGDGIGTSIMTTCFLKSRSWAEVTLLIPMVLFTPLILVAVSYAFIKYNLRYKRYIVRHLSAVVAFSLAWFPAALLHFWNEKDIGNPGSALRGVASVLGALSGFITVVAMLAVPVAVSRCQSSKRLLSANFASLNGLEDRALDTFALSNDAL